MQEVPRVRVEGTRVLVQVPNMVINPNPNPNRVMDRVPNMVIWDYG